MKNELIGSAGLDHSYGKSTESSWSQKDISNAKIVKPRRFKNMTTKQGSLVGTVVGGAAGYGLNRLVSAGDQKKYNELKGKRNLSRVDSDAREALRKKLRNRAIGSTAVGAGLGLVAGHELGAKREFEKSVAGNKAKVRDKVINYLENLDRSKTKTEVFRGDIVKNKAWLGKNRGTQNQHSGTVSNLTAKHDKNGKGHLKVTSTSTKIDRNGKPVDTTIERSFAHQENKGSKHFMHERNKYMGVLTPVSAIRNHIGEDGKKRRALINEAKKRKLSEREIKELRRLNHIRTNKAVGAGVGAAIGSAATFGTLTVPLGMLGDRISRKKLERKGATSSNYSMYDKVKSKFAAKNTLTNKSTVAGAVVGGALGYGANRLISASEYKKYNELKGKQNLSPQDQLARKVLRRKLLARSVGSTLAGAGAGTVVGHELGARKEYNRDINKMKSNVSNAIIKSRNNHKSNELSKAPTFGQMRTSKTTHRIKDTARSKSWLNKGAKTKIHSKTTDNIVSVPGSKAVTTIHEGKLIKYGRNGKKLTTSRVDVTGGNSY